MAQDIIGPGCIVCDLQLPGYKNDKCVITTREAGLQGFVIASCEIEMTAEQMTDLSETGPWVEGYQKNKIVATPFGKNFVGNTIEAEVTTKKTSSCDPERPISRVRGFDFVDHNWDNDASITDFYNYIDCNQCFLKIGYYTCGGLFYGWFNSFVFNPDEVIPEDGLADLAYYTGTVRFTQKTIPKPVYLPQLASVFV